MLTIEEQTQQLLNDYRKHTQMLMDEVQARGEIIRRLLHEIEDSKKVNDLLGKIHHELR